MKSQTFSERVYSFVSKIPKGKVSTYKAIAKRLNTKGYRAVGNVLNKNPNAPKVPCHRVVGSDGALKGYAFGLKKKKELLTKEGIAFEKNGKVKDLKKVIFS